MLFGQGLYVVLLSGLLCVHTPVLFSSTRGSSVIWNEYDGGVASMSGPKSGAS